MSNENKKVVSPFEFAITEICDPEAAKTMRSETYQEKADKIEKKLRSQLGKMRTPDGKKLL